MAPPLKVFQSLWAMQPYDDMGTAFDKVAEAGFDGMAIDLGAADIATAMKTQPHFERTGLTPLIVAFPKSVASLRDTLKMSKDFGGPFVVVIGQVFPLTVEGAIPVIRRWMDMSDEEAMPIQFETHRNCITNDLFFTLNLLDSIPDMPLCAKWVRLFEGWWEQGFRAWRRKNPGEAPVFLCELGPPEYAMTGADGNELSDRWAEALQLRDTARSIWDRVCAEEARV